MINVSLEKNPELYINGFQNCLSFLRDLKEENYSYPAPKVNFHVYSDILNEKQLMSVKSFLATQNLDHAVLNLWSDVDLTKNRLIVPYLPYVVWRKYNPYLETKDTPLEGNDKYIYAKDSKHWLQSGILRFLAIYKYGGIWFDMDMILLRDFRPIMDQEFAYMWGECTDFGRKKSLNSYGPCAALVGGEKQSYHTKTCMEEIARTHLIENTACLDHELLAEVYQLNRFTVFPSCFFEAEWQMGDMGKQVNLEIVDGWFRKNKYSNNLFLETFSWHWHNSGQGKREVEEGSKFDLLQKLTDEKLKDKGLLH